MGPKDIEDLDKMLGALQGLRDVASELMQTNAFLTAARAAKTVQSRSHWPQGTGQEGTHAVTVSFTTEEEALRFAAVISAFTPTPTFEQMVAAFDAEFPLSSSQEGAK